MGMRRRCTDILMSARLTVYVPRDPQLAPIVNAECTAELTLTLPPAATRAVACKNADAAACARTPGPALVQHAGLRVPVRVDRLLLYLELVMVLTPYFASVTHQLKLS